MVTKTCHCVTKAGYPCKLNPYLLGTDPGACHLHQPERYGCHPILAAKKPGQGLLVTSARSLQQPSTIKGLPAAVRSNQPARQQAKTIVPARAINSSRSKPAQIVSLPSLLQQCTKGASMDPTLTPHLQTCLNTPEKLCPLYERLRRQKEANSRLDRSKLMRGEKLGEGSYGKVYRLRDQPGIVMKRYKSGEISPDFLREIGTLSVLRGFPNCLTMVALPDTKGNNIDIYLEAYQGDLRLVHQDANFKKNSESFFKPIMFQLLDGLLILRNRNMLHRDIKPQNILYNPQTKQAVLADYGSCIINQTQANTYEGFSQLFCDPHTDRRILAYRRTPLDAVTTLWYRPPEGFFATETYDFRIDLWSLGATFVEILQGKPLVPGNQEKEQLDLELRLFPQRLKPFDEEENDDWWLLQVSKAVVHYGLAPSYDQYYRKMVSEDSLTVQLQKLNISAQLQELLLRMLDPDYLKRISVEEALRHKYFTAPLAKNTANNKATTKTLTATQISTVHTYLPSEMEQDDLQRVRNLDVYCLHAEAIASASPHLPFQRAALFAWLQSVTLSRKRSYDQLFLTYFLLDAAWQAHSPLSSTPILLLAMAAYWLADILYAVEPLSAWDLTSRDDPSVKSFEEVTKVAEQILLLLDYNLFQTNEWNYLAALFRLHKSPPTVTRTAMELLKYASLDVRNRQFAFETVAKTVFRATNDRLYVNISQDANGHPVSPYPLNTTLLANLHSFDAKSVPGYLPSGMVQLFLPPYKATLIKVEGRYPDRDQLMKALAN